MLSVQNKLMSIKDTLLTVGVDVYHYIAPAGAKLPYIVWYEESESSSIEVDDHKAEQAIYGYVELFTKTEFDANFDKIQNALNSIDGLGWEYANTNYGDPASDDNKVIHHTWGWSVG